MQTPTSTKALADWDRTYLWHPFTPMKAWCENKEIVVIDRGEREFLIDTEGRRYIDGVSSLWCNVHGHCVPELDNAVKEQLNSIAHTTLLGLSNVPAITLAKRLVDLARAGGLQFDKVFYSDNGSTAVEVACKMAYQYWRNLNKAGDGIAGSNARTKFIALESAYHGDTIGAVSVGGIPIFHHAFKSLCFPVDFATSIKQMETLLSQNRNAYAAIIIEPLIQGAGGMLMHPPQFLRDLRQLADRYNTLLIFDEVLTGFGRTGKMFAAEHAQITPDLMCLSKGLTAGYMPLGVTMTTRKIFDAFYVDPNLPENSAKTFFHGHTFTGHPLACAVALASLDLFEKSNLLSHVARLQPILAATLEEAKKRACVSDVRQCGLIGAIDLTQKDGTPFPYHWRIGGALCTRMRTLEPMRLMMRPIADTLVIMPPLAISEENFRHLCAGVLKSLDWIPEVIAQKQ
ncbi:MAG TPA: adenosylmethionine--8-amino-7-oxononanoate transaminase [Phycisphaerae bacterium]|nr:adenosylmethionine--8-amino-7-oxononanoate transaminase [Phycisphaerae bacterium]